MQYAKSLFLRNPFFEFKGINRLKYLKCFFKPVKHLLAHFRREAVDIDRIV